MPGCQPLLCSSLKSTADSCINILSRAALKGSMKYKVSVSGRLFEPNFSHEFAKKVWHDVVSTTLNVLLLSPTDQQKLLLEPWT